MENLITTNQHNELTRMLNDQQVSINNIEVIDPELVLPPSPRNNPKLFRPFEDDASCGIKRCTDDFNDWADFYLSKPNGLF